MSKQYNYHSDNPSFLIYKDAEEDVFELSDEDAGKVFKAVFAFAKRGEKVTLDGEAKVVYRGICRSIDRDGAKYESKCRTNSLNGKKAHQKTVGGRYSSETERENDIAFEKDGEADLDTDIDIAAIESAIGERPDEESCRKVGLSIDQKDLESVLNDFGLETVRPYLVHMAMWQLKYKRRYRDTAKTLIEWIAEDRKKAENSKPSYDLDKWWDYAMNHVPDFGNSDTPSPETNTT